MGVKNIRHIRQLTGTGCQVFMRTYASVGIIRQAEIDQFTYSILFKTPVQSLTHFNVFCSRSPLSINQERPVRFIDRSNLFYTGIFLFFYQILD